MPQQENVRAHKVWTVEGDLNLKGTLSKNGVDVTEQMALVLYRRVTIAEMNAGEELLPAMTGKQYRITGLLVRAIGGAVAAVTNILIQDGASSPVVVATLAQAQLTQNTILTENTTGATMGAAFLLGTTVSKALNIIKSGNDITTATHLDVVIEYQVITP